MAEQPSGLDAVKLKIVCEDHNVVKLGTVGPYSSDPSVVLQVRARFLPNPLFTDEERLEKLELALSFNFDERAFTADGGDLSEQDGQVHIIYELLEPGWPRLDLPYVTDERLYPTFFVGELADTILEASSEYERQQDSARATRLIAKTGVLMRYAKRVHPPVADLPDWAGLASAVEDYARSGADLAAVGSRFISSGSRIDRPLRTLQSEIPRPPELATYRATMNNRTRRRLRYDGRQPSS